jgi:hypothetical protein
VRAIGDPSQIVDDYTGVAREGRKVEQTEGTRWGSGEVRYQSIELLDGEGKPVSFGRTGDPLTIRLHFTAYQPIENVVFGIGIDHQNGQHMSGTNTRRHGRTVPRVEGSGYLDYVIPSLNLLEGTYNLSAAIADWTEGHDYDSWRHGLRFDVLPSHIHEQGYVSLGGSWRLERTLAAAEDGHVDAR